VPVVLTSLRARRSPGFGLPAAARPRENVVNFIDRVMRVMTPINIGAALGLAVGVLTGAVL
jgi:hypothetical protein